MSNYKSQTIEDILQCKNELSKMASRLFEFNNKYVIQLPYQGNMMINLQREVEQAMGTLNTLSKSDQISIYMQENGTMLNEEFTHVRSVSNQSIVFRELRERTISPISSSSQELRVPSVVTLQTELKLQEHPLRFDEPVEDEKQQEEKNEVKEKEITILKRPIIKPFSRKVRKTRINNIEIRPGMYLDTLDHDAEHDIINKDEFKDIQFYFRDPEIHKGYNGLYKLWLGNSTYFIANNGVLYIYDKETEMLIPGVWDGKEQHWKQ